MNWEGAYHYVRPPDGRERGVDREPILTQGDSREIVGREAACFERERRPTTSREKGTRPDIHLFS